MPRARNIKPSFFTNERLAELSPLARLLFAGLWCLADREGRLEDRPKRIKAEVLPYDDCDPEPLLRNLSDSDFILRYEVGGRCYIEVLNFKKHQRPHSKEAKSVIPAPDQGCREKVVSSTNLGCIEHQSRSLLARSDSLSSDSGLLIADSKRGKGIGETNPAPSFLAFWTAYPRKRSKGQAEKTWIKLKPDAALFAKIVRGLERARGSPDWLKDGGQFIPHPSTWLNAKGWEDDYGEIAPSPQEPPFSPPDPRDKAALAEQLARVDGMAADLAKRKAVT